MGEWILNIEKTIVLARFLSQFSDNDITRMTVGVWYVVNLPVFRRCVVDIEVIILYHGILPNMLQMLYTWNKCFDTVFRYRLRFKNHKLVIPVSMVTRWAFSYCAYFSFNYLHIVMLLSIFDPPFISEKDISEYHDECWCSNLFISSLN